MRHELGNVAMSLRKIERHADDQAARRASDSEVLHGLLRRVTSIERSLALTELSRPPRVNRRRPLD
jgi:hypothetical protein